ncbi:MAG: hypothetical protein E5W00_16500, partial [Mesorhizobium sp.]
MPGLRGVCTGPCFRRKRLSRAIRNDAPARTHPFGLSKGDPVMIKAFVVDNDRLRLADDLLAN